MQKITISFPTQRAMLSIILTVLVAVNGQTCLKTNNDNGPPKLMDYGPRRSVSTIPALHQVIIPSYRFTCCGNITEWRVGVHPRARGRKHDRIDTLNFQVWRPSPTVKSTGCYSLIGDNSFSVSLTDQVAMVTPSPQHQIQFQPGDVLGFSLENARSDGGVVIDSREQEGNGEEVWYAHIRNVISADVHCPFSMDTQVGRVLNTSTNAAPVISVSYSTIACPPQITPTTLNSASAPKSTVSFDSVSINPPKVTDPVFGHSGDCSYNYKLITGVIVAVLVVAITITLTLILSFARYVKLHKHEAPTTVLNEDSSTGIQDTEYTERDTGDYPSMDDQAMESINIKQNKAYATNVETKQCVAYAAKITTERNSAYGTKFQDVILHRETDTYDYPAMDD